jgi:hypothetical protein
MFSNTYQDRFGMPYVPRTAKMELPGPGWYQKESERPRALVSSSAFLSAVQRENEGAQAQTAPGPGKLFAQCRCFIFLGIVSSQIHGLFL